MRLLIAINVSFLSVQNVEDTDLWGYFFWHITLILVLCQRTQIWGNIYFGGHRSEYDVRGHRSEEICFWKDIYLGVTSEDTDLMGQGFGRTWIWVWRSDWTQIWGKDTDLRPCTDLSLTYIYIYIYNVWNSHIDKNTFDYLKPDKPKVGRFYLLPKIHKVNNPGDPLFQQMGTPQKKSPNSSISTFDLM